MQILPAVEIRSGKCVRLSHGDDQHETVYGDSPADMALRWVSDGAQALHLVDLDGARDGTANNFEAICEIVQQANVPLYLGGGIRDEATIKRYLDVGIDRLVVGTRALKEPRWAMEMAMKYPNQILLGLDTKDGLLASEGWLKMTTHSPVDFALQMANYPIAGIVFTDIVRDGTMNGPNLKAQEQFRDAVRVPVIVSGGIANANHVSQLAALGLDGCVIGRALYEGRLTIEECLNAVTEGVAQTPASRQFNSEAPGAQLCFATFEISGDQATLRSIDAIKHAVIIAKKFNFKHQGDQYE